MFLNRRRAKRSLGLSFLGNGKADITPDALMKLLTDSRAKLVILATCASSTFGLEKLKAGPAVVVTNSGVHLVTWSANWGIALQHFLLLLIGYEIDGAGRQPVPRKKGRATISEALEAAFSTAADSTIDRTARTSCAQHDRRRFAQLVRGLPGENSYPVQAGRLARAQ